MPNHPKHTRFSHDFARAVITRRIALKFSDPPTPIEVLCADACAQLDFADEKIQRQKEKIKAIADLNREEQDD